MYDGYADVGRRQRAKKEHQCSYCKGGIRVGEVYGVLVTLPKMYYAHCSDGSVESEEVEFGWAKVCDECWERTMNEWYGVE